MNSQIKGQDTTSSRIGKSGNGALRLIHRVYLYPSMSSQLATQKTPTLPSLGTDTYLLDTGDPTTGPLQALVLDHLLMNEGTAYWVDAAGHARTDTLACIAPSTRLLHRIQVARGFTAYQHAALIERVVERITSETALVVAPAIDAMYRDDDSYGVNTAELLRTAVETLTNRCREYDIPLVVTCHRRDALSAPVARHVDETIRCETTRFGPRFIGDGFETLVYPLGDDVVQTTLTFWEHVLERRATVTSPSQSEVIVRGSN